MAAYRLMSTRHHPDGSVEPPSVTIDIDAADDRAADAVARDVPLDLYVDDADFAWLIDAGGAIVSAFPVARGHGA